jgi:starvation-inducible DNA-binding protein
MQTELTESMKKVLANTFSLYLKSHNFHWNVEGMFFSELHDFFGNLYSELWAAVDPIAEHIRYLDSYAPGALSRYIELSSIQDELTVPTARDMITILLADNDIVRASLYDAFKQANAANEQGLSNFIQDRIGAHDKHHWMLRSFLKLV